MQIFSLLWDVRWCAKTLLQLHSTWFLQDLHLQSQHFLQDHSQHHLQDMHLHSQCLLEDNSQHHLPRFPSKQPASSARPQPVPSSRLPSTVSANSDPGLSIWNLPSDTFDVSHGSVAPTVPVLSYSEVLQSTIEWNFHEPSQPLVEAIPDIFIPVSISTSSCIYTAS